MEFQLNTRDIQLIQIALINSKCLAKDSVITEDDYKRLQNRLTDLNNLTCRENSYTLTVTVTA